MQGEIRNLIEKALKNLSLSEDGFTVEQPANIENGDYSSNVAMILAQKEKQNPKELAQKITDEINKDKPELIDQVEVAPPGFINFYLSKNFFEKQIGSILDLGDKFGSNKNLDGKKIIVEYTQPNLFKVFHVGHINGTTIGESLSRILSFSGAKVVRANYQGDIGLHVAKAIWGMQEKEINPENLEKIGEAYAYGSQAYEDDENAKKEIVDLNKRLYAKDSELDDIYKKGREASLRGFDEMYKLLGTEFDRLFFESETWEEGKKIVEEGLQKGIFEESEGAVVFPGEKYGLHTRVFITKEGIPTYEAKDLGLIALKAREYDFDKSIVETGGEQNDYFDVVFKAAELLHPEYAGKLKHLHHGMMTLTTGKMSSRTGKVLLAKPLIEEMIEKASDKVSDRGIDTTDEISKQVAVGAIKYMILKQGVGKNIVFDPEKSLSFEGDSGPYLQYTLVRAKSVMEKAKKAKIKPENTNKNDSVTHLERLLTHFPEVVVEAEKNYAPQHITQFLISLCSAFNSWYAQEKIVDPENANAPYNVALVLALKNTLENGLNLLGIPTPEKM